MWIRGDRQVIDTMRKILVSCVVALLLVAIYFEQFTLLELEFILVILGCKPSLDIGFSRSRNLIVVLIKFV